MKPTQKLTADQRFFFTWAGYSYDPLTQTPEQGRTKCAIALADAEALFLKAYKVADVCIEWVDDLDADEPEHKVATIWNRVSDIEAVGLATLGSIDRPDENYKRVVRAELADECRNKLREIVAKATKAHNAEF